MELTDSLKALFIDMAKALNGSARRVFMAPSAEGSKNWVLVDNGTPNRS